jgi:hypothetical protein
MIGFVGAERNEVISTKCPRKHARLTLEQHFFRQAATVCAKFGLLLCHTCAAYVLT